MVGDTGDFGRAGGARQRTLAHLQALVTAAAVVGAGSSTASCKKMLGQGKSDGAPDDADVTNAADGAAAGPAGTVPPVADPNATAESTLDATAFADAGEVQARADAGKERDAGVGYRVVDPMPTPTRIPKGGKRTVGCEPPYYFDAQGRKHYKPECL